LKIDGSDEGIKDHLNAAELLLNFDPFNHIFAGIGETFKNLEELTVIGSQIKFVERGNFEHLEKLKRLFLNNKQIEHLPENVFWDLKNLKELYLEHNRIKELSAKVFTNLKIIERIDLKNNNIKHFPSSLLSENLKLQFFVIVGNPGNPSSIEISKIPNVKFFR
jgi:Leucine-rich repeat (LRR) protein